VFQVDDRLKLDFDRREIWVDGKLVRLRPTEFKLLYHLVQNAGWVVPHEQLLAKVWGYEYREETHYLRLYVNYLRQKLERDPADPQYILTERGVGYRFVDFRRQAPGGLPSQPQ
jgi:two-component system KDP operon response regulator KdpE